MKQKIPWPPKPIVCSLDQAYIMLARTIEEHIKNEARTKRKSERFSKSPRFKET